MAVTRLDWRGAIGAFVSVALMTTGAVAQHRPPMDRPPTTADGAPLQAPWRSDPFPSTYRPLPRTDLILRHATVLDGAGKRIDNGDVLIHEGVISAIGVGLNNPGGVREIDATGRWVTPGVIDVHSHDGTYVVPLTTIDHDSSDVSELSDLNVADTWIETAVNPQDTGFSRALRGGVTTIQILPGSSPIFAGRSVVVKPIHATSVAAMKFLGAPQGFKMSCGENPKQQGADSHRGPTSRQGEVAFLRKAFIDAQDYRRDWDHYRDHGGPPFRRDLKREALAGILSGDIRLNMHCYRSDDMAIYLAVAREMGFHIVAFHHAVEAYKIPALLRENDTCAAVWGDWWGYKMEALDGVRANAALLDRAGVCVTMHSDSANSGQRLTLEAAKSMGAAARIGIVVPPERAIRWVTSNAAKVLGMADRIGTLAPGYDGDVTMWSGNPFSIYTRAQLVLIDGAIAFDRAAPPGPPASDFELGRRAVVRP